MMMGMDSVYSSSHIDLELFNSEYNSTNNGTNTSTRYDEQKKINTERILQEQLTDEMVKMAQYLKQNALGIERITKNDEEACY